MIGYLEQTSTDVKFYHLSRAFITAEFMAALAWQIYCLGIQFVDQAFSKGFEILTMIIIYALIIAVLHYLPKSSPGNYSLLHISLVTCLTNDYKGVKRHGGDRECLDGHIGVVCEDKGRRPANIRK